MSWGVKTISTGKTPKGFKQVLRVLTFVMSVAGVFLFLSGIFEIIRINQIKEWPTTTGKVEAADIKTDVKVVGDIDGNHPIRIPVVVVKFKYYLNGKEYVLSKELHNHDFPSARKFVRQYSTGKEIIVYYNPRNYHDAEVQLESALESYFRLTIGLFFLLIGIFNFRNSKEYANH